MASQALDIPELPFQASVAGQISAFDLLDWLSGGRVNIVQVYPATEAG
ncbi:MAG TPA: hypothetical protein VFR91_08995 [Dyella sp.]|nr:hypothetical protein [Dyella sp.]